MLRVTGHLPIGNFARFAEPDDQVGGERARPHAPLLPAAANEAGEPDPGLPPHEQRPDSLGPVYFMAADAQQVDVHFVDVQWDLPKGLSGVSVEVDAPLPAHLANGTDVLDNTDLVVHGHYAAA